MEDTGISNDVAQMFVQIAEINLDPVLFKKLMEKSRQVASLVDGKDQVFHDKTIDLRVKSQ